MTLCANCGAPLAPDARFCSKCATPVATPGPASYGATVPAAQARRSTWWIVPLVIVVLVVITWLVVAGLPFGGEKRVVATATTETIAEGTTDAQSEPTGTVVELGGTAEPPFATETAPPPQRSTSTQIVTQTQPPPTIIEEPTVTQDPIPAPPRPIPRPAPVETAPEREPPQAETRAELGEAEATSILRSHLAATKPYDGVSADCLELRSVGYVNAGYTYSAWDACVEGGGTRMLGRWRVDAKTREVFRQRDDGRYVRP